MSKKIIVKQSNVKENASKPKLTLRTPKIEETPDTLLVNLKFAMEEIRETQDLKKVFDNIIRVLLNYYLKTEGQIPSDYENIIIKYKILKNNVDSKLVKEEVVDVFLRYYFGDNCKYYENTKKTMMCYDFEKSLWVQKDGKDNIANYFQMRIIGMVVHFYNIVTEIIVKLIKEEKIKLLLDEVEGLDEVLLDHLKSNKGYESVLYGKRNIEILKWYDDKLHDEDIMKKLNRQPLMSFNTENGKFVVDFLTGEVRTRKREDYVTFYIDAIYIKKELRDKDYENNLGEFMEYMSELASGKRTNVDRLDERCREILGLKENEEIPEKKKEELEEEFTILEQQQFINCLLDVTGYSLSPFTNEQTMFVLHGPPSSGKSTFIRLINTIFSKVSQCINSNILTSKNNSNTSGPTPEIMNLEEAWLSYAEEVNKNQKLDVASVLKLVGDGKISGRGHHEKTRSFEILTKIWLAVNDIPTFPPTQNILRRYIELRFDAEYKQLNYPELEELDGFFLKEKIRDTLLLHINDKEEVNKKLNEIMILESKNEMEENLRNLIDINTSDKRKGIFPLKKNFLQKFTTGKMKNVIFTEIIDRTIKYARKRSIYYPDIVKQFKTQTEENMKEESLLDKFIKEECETTLINYKGLTIFTGCEEFTQCFKTYFEMNKNERHGKYNYSPSALCNVLTSLHRTAVPKIMPIEKLKRSSMVFNWIKIKDPLKFKGHANF